MTKNELLELRFLSQEIQEQQERITTLEAQATKTTPVLSDMPSGHTVSSKVEKYAIEIADLRSLIEVNIKKRNIEEQQLEEWINALPKSRDRLLFRSKYIEGLTWERVGEKIGLSDKCCQGIHDNILKNVRKSS